MRFVSCTDSSGAAGVGVVDADQRTVRMVGESVIGAPTPFASPMRRLLHIAGMRLSEIGEEDLLPPVPLDALSIEPIVPDPGRIIAAPVNYRDHQSEMSQDAHVSALGFFLKSSSSVLATGGTVRVPYSDRRFDQEGEFAVVIGRAASNITPEEVPDVIAGYTLLLDMTMRGGEDRSIRKSFDTFTPVGPYLVTPEEAGPVEDLVLRCWVAGELRQQARLSDLIWDVPRFVAYASSVTALQPGDIVTTGTPAGVGRVQDGDEVTVEVEPLGRLSVTVRMIDAVPSPTAGADRGPKPPETVTAIRALR
jgi:2-keto-4-pentenoate hydratase/2-oxohepta-3-ene-1,7-dioic acid hydratase in catechol pathway